ncbi:MAG: hypothetical protein MZV49_08910 [Rhodopseudomonas palustris]|nr:hypothetical protein [Rhodopseudomonas palustris]
MAFWQGIQAGSSNATGESVGILVKSTAGDGTPSPSRRTSSSRAASRPTRRSASSWTIPAATATSSSGSTTGSPATGQAWSWGCRQASASSIPPGRDPPPAYRRTGSWAGRLRHRYGILFDGLSDGDAFADNNLVWGGDSTENVYGLVRT